MSTTILIPVGGPAPSPSPTLPKAAPQRSRGDKLPDIGDVAVQDPRHLQVFLDRLREIVQTREGHRGSELQRNVTVGDLTYFGLVVKTAYGSYVGVADDRARPPGFFSPSPDAVFVGVTAGFSTIFVEWVPPIYTQGGGHAYTEVWAAQYSGTGPLPVFSDAFLVSKEVASFYAYPAGLQAQVHFWLINRSLADVAQTTPTGGLNGQYATSAGMDIDYALELIAGANANAPLWSAGEAVTLQEVRRITGVNTKVLVCKQAGTTGGTAPSIAGAIGTMVTDGTVLWQIASTTMFAVLDAPTTINGVTLPAGAYIDAAYVSNATIQTAQIADLAVDNAKIADLSVAKLLAGNMQVGSYIRSTSFISGSSGWTINADGNVEFNNGTFRGALGAATGTFAGSLSAATGTFAGSLSAATGTFAGSLSAATGTFAGSLSAATGTFAGSVTVGTTPAISGATMTGTGAVFNSGGTWAAGNSTTNISFNGTALTLNGQVVNTANISERAATDVLSAQGDSASISVSIVVPSGETYKVVAMGSQGNKLDPAVTTLTVLGVTVNAGKLFVAVDVGDSTVLEARLPPVSVMGASVFSAGTHEITLVGEALAYKTLAVFVSKR